MPAKRIINKEKTVQNILDRINRNPAAYSLNMKKFNQHINDEEFLEQAAKFVDAEIVYRD